MDLNPFSPLFFLLSFFFFFKLYSRLLSPWDFPGKRLEWVAISFSRGSSWPRDQTQVSCIAGTFFTVWAIREAPKLRRKWIWIHPPPSLFFISSFFFLFLLFTYLAVLGLSVNGDLRSSLWPVRLFKLQEPFFSCSYEHLVAARGI